MCAMPRASRESCSALVSSSPMPSLKYSSSALPPTFTRGRTATDLMSAASSAPRDARNQSAIDAMVAAAVSSSTDRCQPSLSRVRAQVLPTTPATGSLVRTGLKQLQQFSGMLRSIRRPLTQATHDEISAPRRKGRAALEEWFRWLHGMRSEIACVVRPANGGEPVSASYATTPNA